MIHFRFSIGHDRRRPIRRFCWADRKISDEAIAIGDGAAGVENLALEPIDLQGIVAVAPRDVVDPTVTVDDLDLTALDRFFVGLKIDPGDAFLDKGMRGRLADEDEMPVDGADGFAQGWRENRSSPR